MESFDILTLATPAVVAIIATAILQYFKLRDLFNSGAIQIRLLNLILCIVFVFIGRSLTTPINYETIIYAVFNGLVATLMSAGLYDLALSKTQKDQIYNDK